MVQADITAEALRALDEGGVRGVRFNFVGHLGADADRGAIRTIVEKVIPLGWHAVIHFDSHRLAELAPFLRELPLTLVIDHRSEEHTSELQSPHRISSSVHCLQIKHSNTQQTN